MKQVKRFILRVLFTTEIILFCFIYVFGINGLSALWRLKQENVDLKNRIRKEDGMVKNLKIEIKAWENYPFFKEKVAREKLQMMKKGEVIYFIPEGLSGDSRQNIHAG